MQRAKYAPEFKDEAVKQVIDKGHSVVAVAKRPGIAGGVLYTWVSIRQSALPFSRFQSVYLLQAS
jgi:transposase